MFSAVGAAHRTATSGEVFAAEFIRAGSIHCGHARSLAPYAHPRKRWCRGSEPRHSARFVRTPLPSHEWNAIHVPLGDQGGLLPLSRNRSNRLDRRVRIANRSASAVHLAITYMKKPWYWGRSNVDILHPTLYLSGIL